MTHDRSPTPPPDREHPPAAHVANHQTPGRPRPRRPNACPTGDSRSRPCPHQDLREIVARRPASIEAHHPQTTTPSSSAPSRDRKSTRLNSSHVAISYAVFCLKKKKPVTTVNTNRKKQ